MTTTTPTAAPNPDPATAAAAGTPGHRRLSRAILDRAQRDGIALVPFVTAGYPDMAGFEQLVTDLAPHAGAIEIGAPFSDPMADGMTIQRSSRAALAAGVTLSWILATLQQARPRLADRAPLVLMSYLNPLLALGDELGRRCEAAGITAIIVPDLPFEEREILTGRLAPHGVGLIQMATPVTPAERLSVLGGATEGFLYAVTMMGVTGGARPQAGAGRPPTPPPPPLDAYLAALRAATPGPVCAGFGLRDAAGVQALRGKAHGAIVGSALIEVLERGESPAAFLASLRA